MLYIQTPKKVIIACSYIQTPKNIVIGRIYKHQKTSL